MPRCPQSRAASSESRPKYGSMAAALQGAMSASRGVFHQRLPDANSAALGTLHGQSQCLEVLDIAGEWAHVTAWNHERGDRVTGYVPMKNLKSAAPNGPYGLLIDKRTQTLALFIDGVRAAEVPISTGLVAKDRLIRETAAGSFLTVERIAGFADSGYYYDYPIRYDGGNLIHQVGYKKVNGRSDFSDQTPLLGQKGSHGCVRVQRETEPATGLCAYWLWTHLPYHTRVMILDDIRATAKGYQRLAVKALRKRGVAFEE